MDIQLDPDEADAIVELFNIGMGPPAAALSEMVGEEVGLSIPDLRVDLRQRITGELGLEPAGRVFAVTEVFDGAFSGEAMLVFPEPDGRALVGCVVPGLAGLEDGRDEVERDALSEIGNIILNGCLASLANLMGGEVAGAPPGCHLGPVAGLVGDAADPVLVVRIDVALPSHRVCGRTLFLLDVGALPAFRQAIRRLLGSLAD